MVFQLTRNPVGDIISVKILGQPIVIIQSSQIAVDMLEKRSVTYSDRPRLTMGGELVGWKNTLALTPYGPRFREYRSVRLTMYMSIV